MFSSSEPLKASKLASVAGLKKGDIDEIIKRLNAVYEETNRSFRVENVAGGFQMLTLPEFHSYIHKAQIIEKRIRLSQASLETLAIIAYKQPAIRAEIEKIRGVDCGGVLKNLMAKDLIVIDGKSPAPGNPLLYKTSEYFLEFFGLPSIEHLPQLSEIEEISDRAMALKFIKKPETDNGEGIKNDLDETTNRLAETEVTEPGDSKDIVDLVEEPVVVAETDDSTEN